MKSEDIMTSLRIVVGVLVALVCLAIGVFKLIAGSTAPVFSFLFWLLMALMGGSILPSAEQIEDWEKSLDDKKQ